MKQKITLLGIMLVVSTFAFSQIDVKKRFGASFNTEFNSKDGIQWKTRISDLKKIQKPVLKAATTKNNQLDYAISREWNSENNQWEISGKIEFTYDANGKLVFEFETAWNSETALWENYSKREHTYDANGNASVEVYILWNNATHLWENYSKFEYVYDANGRVTTEIQSKWNNTSNQWENRHRAEYSFDASENPIAEIQSNWNNLASIWEILWKYDYIYDADGNRTFLIGSDWDSQTSQYVSATKYEYVYDANGKPTVGIYLLKNENTGQWENYSKSVYAFDVNGNSTDEIYSFWNSEKGEWDNSGKNVYTYDLSYRISDIIMPPLTFFTNDYAELIVNMPVDYFSYDFEKGNWVNDNKLTFYYSNLVATSLHNLIANTCSVYPSPVVDVLNVSFQSKNSKASFELYNTQGRKLISKAIENNEQLNLEALNSGVYIYYLNIDGEIKIGKFIKE